MKNRIITFSILFTLILPVFPQYNVIVSKAESNGAPCVTYNGDNAEDQDYRTWSKPVYSYLSKCSDGTLMTVQYMTDSSMKGKFVVEYYDSNYNFLSNKEVNLDLPLFGGFYETNDNYYILSGQTNYAEDNTVEVYRITKYDKKWNRLGSCGLLGANTYIPFDAGSARMTSVGDYLLIRTCHEMYESDDGYHHQANVTIEVDMKNLEITDSYTSVANKGVGYISHSFNQFIQLENNKIVAVDHGDAYPRSIVLVNYSKDVTTGTFKSGCSTTDLISFSGEIGANYTGASVGGFEISSKAYIVAGNQDISSSSSDGRNIFTVSKDKSTGNVTYNKITDYEAGKGSASTPHLVKLATDSYMLLWSYNSKVYYTKIDANGKKIGEIYSMDGSLSDCVPVMSGNNLVWYVWDDDIVSFYSINTSSLKDNSVTETITGHDYVYGTTVKDGYIDVTCSKCGDSMKKSVPTSFNCYFSQAQYSNYSTKISDRYDLNDTVNLWVNLSGSYDLDEMEVISSDESTLSVSKKYDYELNMLKAGVVTVTVRPKYNQEIARDYIFRIGDDASLSLDSCEIDIDVSTGNYNDVASGVSIEYKGTVLDENDYTVDSKLSADRTTLTVTITGKGLFEGSKIVKDIVVKKPEENKNNSNNNSPSSNVLPWSDDKPSDNDNGNNTSSGNKIVGFYIDSNGDTRCNDTNGNPVINEFMCDGTYTYYFQLDGTAMKDRLTYHPDGVHVIYFDSEGHEVFSDFANVKKTIAGDAVDDFCFFDVFGYMYVDVLTYDKTGSVLYYANPYGVMEMGKWFQFSDTVEWADGTPAEGIAGGYGYANADGTLMTNTQTVDWEGRSCYLQGNGVALY